MKPMRADDRIAPAGVLAVSLCVGMVVAITTGGSPGPELAVSDERPGVTSLIPERLPVLSVAAAAVSPDGQTALPVPRVRPPAVVAATPMNEAAPTVTWVRPTTTRASDPPPPVTTRPTSTEPTSTSGPSFEPGPTTVPPDESTTATSDPETGWEPSDDHANTDTDTTAPAETTTSTSTPDGGDF